MWYTIGNSNEKRVCAHSTKLPHNTVQYVAQRGIRVKARANQTTQLHPRQLFFFQRKDKRAALGGIQTHDTRLSR